MSTVPDETHSSDGAIDSPHTTEEKVDEAGEESFPASDPPAWPSRSREESDPDVKP